MRVTIKQLQDLVAEARSDLSEAQAQSLNPVGDPISDEYIDEFLSDLKMELLASFIDDVEWAEKKLGPMEAFEHQVDEMLSQVESYMRNRLLDLWAGQYMGATPFNEADYAD